MAAFRIGYWFIMLGLSGVIAAKLTIPLLASWFGVTITITGATAVSGMYLYLLSSFAVAIGIMAALAALAGAVVLVAWGGYEGHQLYTRKKVAKIKAELLKK